MLTRSNLKKRKFSEDIKPVIKSSIYNDNICIDNNSESFTNNIKKCCVVLSKDIKNDMKAELNEEPKADYVLKPEAKDSQNECFAPVKVQCLKCENYYSEIGLTRHSCGTFRCEKCGKGFTNRSKFESHLRHHALIEARQQLSQTTKCQICHSVVRNAYMKKHSKIHKSLQTCAKCGISLNNQEMKAHIKTHFKYVCDFCGKRSQCQVNHERHMNMHEKEKQHPCNECDASFKHLVELARHVTKAHRNIKDGKYECLFCKKIVSAIGHHLRIHKNDPKPCDICHAVLPNESAHKSHVRYHGILEKQGKNRAITPRHLLECDLMPLYCEHCDKTFITKSSLIQHYKSHLFPRTIFPCPYCDENHFENVIDLFQHISLTHQWIPIGYIRCIICSQITPDMENHLKTHLVHQFECEICDLTFSSYLDCKKHYNRRHKLKKRPKTSLHVFMKKYSNPKLNNRKISCLECGEKVRISHINSHVTSHQTFKCLMCHKMFFHRYLLESHERTHERFSQRCPVCSQSFLSHIRLMAHLKMCHKMAFSASKACSRCIIQE